MLDTLEPQLSMSKDSQRQWQDELRLLKEAEPDQSEARGPFFATVISFGATVIRWTSGHHI